MLWASAKPLWTDGSLAAVWPLHGIFVSMLGVCAGVENLRQREAARMSYVRRCKSREWYCVHVHTDCTTGEIMHATAADFSAHCNLPCWQDVTVKQIGAIPECQMLA